MPARVLILTGFGINCERETQRAFERAGAEAQAVHLNDLIADPAQLDRFQIFVVPGGFSFGDDVASGRILANRLRYRLGDALRAFVDEGKLVFGICNGFQVIVKMGLLPGGNETLTQTVTVTHNDSGRFEDRWVGLVRDESTPCVWTVGIDRTEMPIRHGEGKFIARDDAQLESLARHGQVVFRYADAKGAPAKGAYPANPNGSQDDIAGICDRSGRVFGLMPHPEGFQDATMHPQWTRKGMTGEGDGLKIFRNAVAYVETRLLQPT